MSSSNPAAPWPASKSGSLIPFAKEDDRHPGQDKTPHQSLPVELDIAKEEPGKHRDKEG
jgi:hypothetical protein